MNGKRIEKILDLLFNQDDYVTIKYLADKVDVSNKTVISDLDKLEEITKTENVELIRKTGYGIRLMGDKQDKLSLRNKLTEMDNNIINYSSKQRMYIITTLLLLGREEFYTSDFSEILYYSRSTIHNDLQKIKKLLESYKIKLIRERNRPIRIEGKERRIRNCLVEIILEHPDIKKVVELIVDDRKYKIHNNEEIILEPIAVRISDLKMIISIIKKSDNTFINELPLRSFITLLIYLLVSFIRYGEGHMVKLSPDFLQSLEDHELYEEVSVICDKSSPVFLVWLPEIEKRYIQVYWLSQNKDKKDNDKYLQIADTMARKLITSWEKEIGIVFQGSLQLHDSLKKHLIPAIIRFEQGIYFENSLLPKIKLNYSKEFKLVQKSLEQFETLFDEPIAEGEAGYLTLYLLAFLEKVKPSIKVLLVSHISPGGEFFIKEKLKNTIPTIEIVDTVNYFSFYDRNLYDIDLIISTMSLRNHKGIPFVLIDPLIGKEEIKAIQSALDTLQL